MIARTLHRGHATAELRERIKQALDSRHFATFRKLEVTIVGDEVVLDGSVPSFYARQLAVALCQHLPGVYRVADRLIVREPDGIDRSTQSQLSISEQAHELS
jgi:osmotically-inducible protein OsmY